MTWKIQDAILISNFLGFCKICRQSFCETVYSDPEEPAPSFEVAMKQHAESAHTVYWYGALDESPTRVSWHDLCLEVDPDWDRLDHRLRRKFWVWRTNMVYSLVQPLHNLMCHLGAYCEDGPQGEYYKEEVEDDDWGTFQ